MLISLKHVASEHNNNHGNNTKSTIYRELLFCIIISNPHYLSGRWHLCFTDETPEAQRREVSC